MIFPLIKNIAGKYFLSEYMSALKNSLKLPCENIAHLFPIEKYCPLPSYSCLVAKSFCVTEDILGKFWAILCKSNRIWKNE
jgi:hypothetical protein